LIFALLADPKSGRKIVEGKTSCIGRVFLGSWNWKEKGKSGIGGPGGGTGPLSSALGQLGIAKGLKRRGLGWGISRNIRSPK